MAWARFCSRVRFRVGISALRSAPAGLGRDVSGSAARRGRSHQGGEQQGTAGCRDVGLPTGKLPNHRAIRQLPVAPPPKRFEQMTTGCTSAYGRRNEFRRNPPLCRGDGGYVPLAGHALELVSAAVFELEP